MKVKGEMNDTLKDMLERPEEDVQRGDAIPEGMLSKPVSGRQLELDVEQAILADTIGDMLRQARIQQRQTARGLGKALGVSHPRILAVERGGSRVQMATLARVARALGYSITVRLDPQDSNRKPIVMQLPVGDVDSSNHASDE